MGTLKDTQVVKGHPAALPVPAPSHFIRLPPQQVADWAGEKQEV